MWPRRRRPRVGGPAAGGAPTVRPRPPGRLPRTPCRRTRPTTTTRSGATARGPAAATRRCSRRASSPSVPPTAPVSRALDRHRDGDGGLRPEGRCRRLRRARCRGGTGSAETDRPSDVGLTSGTSWSPAGRDVAARSVRTSSGRAHTRVVTRLAARIARAGPRDRPAATEVARPARSSPGRGGRPSRPARSSIGSVRSRRDGSRPRRSTP